MAKSTTISGPNLIAVMLLSRDQELGRLRQKVLEQSGCRVMFPQNREEALEALHTPHDVLVVAHTISRESGAHYAEIFRAKNPKGRIVYICVSTIEHPPEWADETVLGLAGPEDMVRAVLHGRKAD
jgi:CheY-like chemotaxis protein